MDDTAAAMITQVIIGRRVVFAGLHGVARELMTAIGDLAADQIVPDVEAAKAAISEGRI